jgi:hypothetical protein
MMYAHFKSFVFPVHHSSSVTLFTWHSTFFIRCNKIIQVEKPFDHNLTIISAALQHKLQGDYGVIMEISNLLR